MTVSSSRRKSLDNMDQDVKKKLKGLDGTAVPVGYDSLKDTGHPVLEASKRYFLFILFYTYILLRLCTRQQLPVSFMMLSLDVANLNFDSMTMCSLEQNIDGLTDGSDGNTKVRISFHYVCSYVMDFGPLYVMDFGPLLYVMVR